MLRTVSRLMTLRLTPAILALTVLVLSVAACTHRADPRPAACTHPADHGPADALVNELGNLPPYLDSGVVMRLCPEPPRSCPSPPASPPELKRSRIYRQLFALGNASVLALARALTCSDRNLRLNAEMALGELAGPPWDQNDPRPKVDISAALPALIDALNDPDPGIRARAEEDIDAVGPNAAEAVPKLINLLADREESVRAIACISLSHIGPSASRALPALRKTLSDPSQWVRKCARLAIAKITGQSAGAAAT
jgi:HEAT repeats